MNISHNKPYHYSLIHHSLGVPAGGLQPPIYHLDVDNMQSGPHTGGGPISGDGGLLGTKLKGEYSSVNDKSGVENNESLVTEQLLLRLAECDTLSEIRVISLRNQQLTGCLKSLSRCQNLSIAYLQGNLLLEKDLSFLQSFHNLKKLDLSDNSLSSLPPASVFEGLKELRFLYLHNNNITNWNDLQSLVALPKIMHLTLFRNPVCNIPGYRHYLVNSIQSMLALDIHVITDEERIEDASFGYRFRGLNDFMKLHIPDYTKEKSAEQHLFNLEVDVYRLRRIFERNSPSILIQSLYRGYRSRNYVKIYFNERRQKIIKIQKVARGYLLRLKLRRDLRDMLRYTNEEHLMMSNVELRKRAACRRIFENMLEYHIKRETYRGRVRAAIKIQTYFRMRFIKNTSFIQALQLRKYPRLYILKEQKPIFIRILKSLMPLFEARHKLTFEDMLEFLKEDQQYDTIRVTEPDMFPREPIPLKQFIKPIFGNFKIQFNRSLPPDKFADKSFTLRDYIFSDNKPKTDLALKILTNRSSHFNMEKLKKSLEGLKKNPFINQFVFQDQYKDFLVFEPPHLEILITICFKVLDFNRTVNIHEDQQMILFFELLLKRVASTATIRNAYKALKWRKSRPQLPIYEIIEKRAANCIQQIWSDWKIKKRMIALQNIKHHIDMINSPIIYLEQSLYQSLNDIAAKVHNQYRFTEQSVMFDFNPHSYQIAMQVQENIPADGSVPGRYQHISVPRWFNLTLKTPDFPTTQNCNNLLALFHLNVGDCRILPVTHVINYKRQQTDVDRRCYFVELQTSSVEEARKRALVLAYLTYDLRDHNFVRLCTSKMMENSHLLSKMYRIFDKFNVVLADEIKQQPDLKYEYTKQQRQLHDGFICSDRDQNEMRYHNRYKTILFEEKLVHLTIKSDIDEQLMDHEQIQMAQREDLEATTEAGKTVGGLTFWETRKQNEQNLVEMKNRMQDHIKKKTQEYRTLKDEVKQEIKKEFTEELVIKQQEVIKAREIKKIVKNEQKAELDRNVQVFLLLNREERGLRQELCEKQIELHFKEKYLKRVAVRQEENNLQLKKEEREKFIGAFAQAKNLIEKQMKLGNFIKDQKRKLQDNRKKVQIVKRDKEQENHQVAIKNTLYNVSAFEESTQNSSLMMGEVPRNQSQANFVPLYQSNQGFLQSIDKKTRAESAQKAFGIKKTQGVSADRGQTAFSAQQQRQNTQNNQEVFGNHYKSQRRDSYGQSVNFQDLKKRIPYPKEMDMTTNYKDKLLQNIQTKSRPNMKRILNNQVFLEEGIPYAPTDEQLRRNQNAIDAAQHMLGYSSPQNLPPISQNNLPKMGPQGEYQSKGHTTLFSQPKKPNLLPSKIAMSSSGTVSKKIAPSGPLQSSYMSQGEYSYHPIFHS